MTNVELLTELCNVLENDPTDTTRQMLQTMLHSVMESESNARCGAGDGERTADRSNQRNGYRPRALETRESFRNEIASRPLNTLRLPITVHGEVDPPSFWEEFTGHRRYARGQLRFGENESGTAFNHGDRGGNQWLASKGNPVDAYLTAPGTSVPQPTESEQQAFQWSGIRSILHDELGPLSLQQLGVTLGG